MKQFRHFLLLTQLKQDADPIQTVLQNDPALAGCKITGAWSDKTLNKVLSSQANEQYDLVLSHLNVGSLIGRALIEHLREALPGTPLVLLADEEHLDLAKELSILYDLTIVPGRPPYLDLLPSTVRAELGSERALRQSEERFRRIAENAPDMIFRWSYARGFEYVSPASTEVIGYTPEEHYEDPGLSYRSIYIEDIPIYESVFSDFADPQGPRRYCVIRWHHKEGYTVHVEMRMTPIFDRYANLIAIEGIARDISQHVRARERLRELTTRLTNAHEEERRRIARELHDEVGQALSIAKMRMRMVQNALPEDADDANDKLNLLDELIKDTLQDVRTLSHELRPPLLDEMGWEPAIESLCDSFSHRTKLPVKFIYSGAPTRLEPEVELTAYRIVQESLTNTDRHAEASEATVKAELDAEGLHLTIEDNGKGFDVKAVQQADAPYHGLGLLSMRERVDTVGGELTIDAEAGAGTRICVHLPLQREDV